MSIKSGGQFIAGNVAIKMQDRLFTAKRVFENNQEYYDIEVPKGSSLGFTQATKLALVISGTNTTTTPILRYKSNLLQIVDSDFNQALPIKLGSLKDGCLAEMYMGTSSQYIHLTGTVNNYNVLRNTPIFKKRDGTLVPLLGGVTEYKDLNLPYLDGDVLVLNTEDFLKINTTGFEYGPSDFTKQHTFLSNTRLLWKKSPTETHQLATLRDIEELAIGDNFVEVLTYSRNTLDERDLIDDMESNDTCIVLENNSIYVYNNGRWSLREQLSFTDADNGKYFDIEDVDGTHSGKVIWNVLNGGAFQLFIDYTNGIDNVTIIRNSNRSLQVNKLPNVLTFTIPRDGIQYTFDGSENKTFVIDLNPYCSLDQLASYYNDNTSGNLAAFYTAGANVKIHSIDLKPEDLVVKKEGSYLQFNSTDVDASLIKYSKTGYNVNSIKDFLDLDIALTTNVNDFVAGQKMGGASLATQPWVQQWVNDWSEDTLLPNKFNLSLVTDINTILNAPSTGKISLRYGTTNLGTGEQKTLDVELPQVSDSNNGLVSPTQRNLWNTVTSKTATNLVQDGYTSFIGYENSTPRVKSATSTQEANLEINFENNLLEIKDLVTLTGTGLYSGILANKDGVYSYQNEAVTRDDNHLVVNRGYLNSTVVRLSSIPGGTSLLGDKLLVNSISFNDATTTATSVALRVMRTNLTKGTSGTTDVMGPAVTSTKAGFATAAMYNQIEANRVAIEVLNGQGSVGATLGASPTQSDIDNAWTTGKPGVPATEGANVINLTTGDTWRYMYVEGTLKWVNLGVLGGNGIANITTLGVVKSTENVEGMIQVESDGTMSLIGWDKLLTDIESLDIAIDGVETDLANHTSDVITTNSKPHVDPSDRVNWNDALRIANAAIPKVTSAVNNNLVLWSSGGVVKDSGKSFVTDFTSPTNNGIPTALAVQGAITSAVQGETTSRNQAIANLANIYLPLAGGTITGNLTIQGTTTGKFVSTANPTSNMDVSTKQYVDTSSANVNASNLSEDNITSWKTALGVGETSTLVIRRWS